MNKDDLSQYPEGQQEKLKTALTCVGNAETTLDNYKDFLKTEKYKEWNDQQTEKRDEHVKSMIGKCFLFFLKLFNQVCSILA